MGQNSQKSLFMSTAKCALGSASEAGACMGAPAINWHSRCLEAKLVWSTPSKVLEIATAPHMKEFFMRKPVVRLARGIHYLRVMRSAWYNSWDGPHIQKSETRTPEDISIRYKRQHCVIQF